MNDLEDLVREELRARVAAAEAEHPAESAAALLVGVERRLRVARLRLRWTAAGLSTVAVAAAVILPLTLLSPDVTAGQPVQPAGKGPVPLSDPSLTPPGWSPLTYRDAQISVPSSWVVQGPQGSVCGATTNGGVLFGRRYHPERLSRSGCRLPPTTVFVSAIPVRLAPVPAHRLNGIPVGRLPSVRGSVSYAVPSLGVKVTAVGPKASQVVATLTRSPRSVALAPGRQFPVPSGWRWHHFGGIVFAAPRAWRVKRTNRWDNCFLAPVVAGELRLSTATTFGCRGGLASPTDQAGEWPPVAGMTVGSGRIATDAASGQYARCLELRGIRACVAQQGMLAGDFLMVVLTVPGRPAPTVLAIGLGGTGATQRAILDSIRQG
jgi:hypothetical protein